MGNLITAADFPFIIPVYLKWDVKPQGSLFYDISEDVRYDAVQEPTFKCGSLYEWHCHVALSHVCNLECSQTNWGNGESGLGDGFGSTFRCQKS